MEQTSWIHVWIPKSENDRIASKRSSADFEPVSEGEINKRNSKGMSDSDESNISDHKTDSDRELTHLITLKGTESYEYRLQDYLKHELKNRRYTTRTSDDEKFVLYSFQVKSNNVELVIIQLTRRGLGTDHETSVSVVQEQISLGSILPKPPSQKSLDIVSDEKGSNNKKSGKERKFYQTVKSRLMVTEVISRIRAGGNFNFDYCMLVILAGILAFMGLVDNNSVTLVASMLVSPIMGPILAGIFGCVIHDKSLTFQGIRNELISLLMCILIGLFLGVFVALMVLNDSINIDQWPSNQMLSRGRTNGLITGVFVAIPSGAGIALSVLGGNAGSLIGVAISASLLPPAVNAGVFWAISIIATFYTGNDEHIIQGYDSIISHPGLGCSIPSSDGILPSEIRKNFLLYYHCDLAADTLICGIVSLALTLLNIACIIFTGFIILRIKEVTPDKVPQTFSNFWKKDIKAHRNYFKTLKTMSEIKGKPNSSVADQSEPSIHQLDGTFLQNLFTKAHNDQDYLDITRWVAMPIPPPVGNEEKNDDKSKAYQDIIAHAVEEEKKRSNMTYGQVINQVAQEEKDHSSNFPMGFSTPLQRGRKDKHDV